MDDKRLGLALLVPGLWVTSIVWFVIYTLFSPVLFIAMWLSPSPQEIMDQIFGTLPFEIEF